MANVLILADRNGRVDRINRALSGWDADALLSSGSTAQWKIVGDASPGACDVVILDHTEPIEPGLLAISEIRNAESTAKLIVTGIPALEEGARRDLIFQYLEQGAAGYIAEDRLETDLVPAIQQVLSGGAWIEPEMQAELIDRTVALHDALAMLRPYSAASGQAEALTRRQHEVLELLAAGYTNKEIADELYISVGTVKNHVHRILDILRATSREQAAQYYQFLQEPSAAA